MADLTTLEKKLAKAKAGGVVHRAIP